jgi:hypothetical protein
MHYRYKDLEAAQADGKGLGFLPLPATVPNGSLLRNGKSARDRNRKVAPIIISEAFGWCLTPFRCRCAHVIFVANAGQPLRTSNSRWLTMLDILYSWRLCIHDWPAGVPPPGPDFDLKSLSASQLRALVGSYLRKHLGDMYEAELGQDEDDDTDAETAKTTKRKGKSKNRRTKGLVVEVPDVVLSIKPWTSRAFPSPLNHTSANMYFYFFTLQFRRMTLPRILAICPRSLLSSTRMVSFCVAWKTRRNL